MDKNELFKLYAALAMMAYIIKSESKDTPQDIADKALIMAETMLESHGK